MDEETKDMAKAILTALRELGFGNASPMMIPGTTEKIAMELTDINASLKSIASHTSDIADYLEIIANNLPKNQ